MDRGKKVRELFETARALDIEEREAFLEGECGEDEELRQEILSLLDAQAGSPDFLSQPALGKDFHVGERLPERIGKYRILSILGEGGMGTVYEAEQESPHRKVALKVVGIGLRSPKLLQRFHLEAELLARLQHPGIAQIFEAGTFKEGDLERPYIAMELVKGVRLTEYVEKNSLSVRRRLELMAEICDAVHHAHQKSVIHRDLKPANILVDEEGCPKILDFGIATATDSDLQVTTAGTELGQVLGTLPYMSPEQVQGKPGDIDTRSDIYALGVICYRILSGRLPHDFGEIAIAEAARVIAERDPERLSDFDRSYRGDIETIVAKALEKERDRRYQSASDMGEDIHRYLRNETITARPAGTWYQFRKFARRNKGLVAVAGAAFVILLAGIIGMAFALQRVMEAEAEARIEADKAGAISRFFQDVLSSVDPEYGPGKETTVRQMLDDAAEDLEGSFEEQPEVKAVLHDTIGLTYRNIGNMDGGLLHLEKAREILDETPGADPESNTANMNHLAGLYIRLDRPDDSEALIRRALDIRMDAYGAGDQRTQELQHNLSILLRMRGKLEESEALIRSILQAREETLEPNDPSLLTTLNNLASLLEEMGRLEEAEPIYLRVLEARRETLGDRHPNTLTSIHNLGTFYQRTGQLEQAEEFAREAVDGSTEIWDRKHPSTLRSLDLLVYVLGLQGKLDEAEPLGREVLTSREEVLGPDHRDTLGSRETLAMLMREGGKFEEAERLSREIVSFFRGRLGDDHPRTLGARYNLAKAQMGNGRLREATSILREIAATGDRVLPITYPHREIMHAKLGQALRKAGKLEEAEDVLLAAYEAFDKEGIQPRHVIDELAVLYREWEKPDEEKRWAAKLESLE